MTDTTQNDLVKRLREDQPVTQDMASTMQCELQNEAADRIEELEAKLAEALVSLADLYRLHLRRGPSWDHPPTKEIMDKARTILVERKRQDDE